MITIRYLANPNSVHVQQWLGLLDRGARVEIFTIEHSPKENVLGLNVKCFSPLPRWMRFLPKIVRYIALGLFLRTSDGNHSAFHAHNSSGYGLTALVTGQRYVLTTYGSEIFGVKRRGVLYQLLIQSILSNAAEITCTSEEMLKVLTSLFRVEMERISYFSLGVSPEFTDLPSNRVFPGKCGRHIWFVNRRITPLYRTREVVKAFMQFKDSGGEGELILIKGDSFGAYFEEIQRLVAQRDDIDLVTEFLTPAEMIEILDRADFVISIPDSDQLSSSILEGMARGCVPILRDLASYRELSKNAFILSPSDGDLQKALEVMFKRTAAIQLTQLRDMSLLAQNEVRERYTRENAVSRYRDIIDHHLLPTQN